MLSFLNPRVPGQSNDTPERHPRSLSLGVHTWNPPTGRSLAYETDPLGMLGSNP